MILRNQERKRSFQRRRPLAIKDKNLHSLKSVVNSAQCSSNDRSLVTRRDPPMIQDITLRYSGVNILDRTAAPRNIRNGIRNRPCSLLGVLQAACLRATPHHKNQLPKPYSYGRSFVRRGLRAIAQLILDLAASILPPAQQDPNIFYRHQLAD